MSFFKFRHMLTAAMLILAPSAAFGQACAGLAGNWNGTFTRDGAGAQPMSIIISAGCDAEWTLPNQCKILNLKGNTASYQCSRGSVGTVTIAKNALTWRNTVTGPQHGFYTVKVRR